MSRSLSAPLAARLLRHPVLRGALLFFGIWTLVGLLFAFQYFLFRKASGEPYTLLSFFRTLTGWWMWVGLTPIALWIARRFPIERPNWLRSIARHLLGWFLVATLDLLLYQPVVMLLARLSDTDYALRETLELYLLGTYTFDLFVYAAIVAVAHAINYHRKLREREVQASRLQAQLAQARFQALKMQLHPHFLFNTLHAVSALMDEDVATARHMLTLLGELLRLTLDRAAQQEIPLTHEVAFIERYLEIQQLRFRGQLGVQIHIDADVQAASVPTLILQPIVENAVIHGTAPEGCSRIDIRAFHRKRILYLQVTDNGPGLPRREGRPVLRNGIGLCNTRERLQQRYGADGRLSLKEMADGGLQVTLCFPFYTAADTLEVVGA